MATITVRYFAAAAEAAGRDQERLTVDDPDAASTVGALRAELLATARRWRRC
jgi:molybdopterin converting factor small subunit